MTDNKIIAVLSRGALTDIISLSLLWSLTIWTVNPAGEFPLNDDWLFGLSVEHMLETGAFRPPAWAAMTLFSHTLWGALFASLFGFSLTVLRFSIVTLGLIGVIGTYLLIRIIRDSRWIALTGALSLAFNPVYYALSFSFMTDVTFTTFTVLSLLFFTHFLKTEFLVSLIFGILLATAATLCRQVGLFLPLSFALAILIKNGWSRKSVLYALVPLIVVIGFFLTFQLWIRLNQITLPLSDQTTRYATAALLTPNLMVLGIARHGFIISLYLGLFLVPMLLLLLDYENTLKNYRFFIVSVAVALVYILPLRWMIKTDHLMPLLNNSYLNRGGVGPILLYDVSALGLQHYHSFSSLLWTIITIISVICAIFLVTYILKGIFALIQNLDCFRGNFRYAIIILLITGMVLYCMPIFFGKIHDRYIIPLIPLASCLLIVLTDKSRSAVHRPWNLYPAAFAVIIVMGFTVLGTRDYMEWNRVRWQAVNSLISEQSVSPQSIDGGYEFNGWFSFGSLYFKREDLSVSFDQLLNKAHAEYRVTMGPVAGFETVQEYPYWRWLPPGRASIFLLRRKEI